jgi:hypothetical protein
VGGNRDHGRDTGIATRSEIDLDSGWYSACWLDAYCHSPTPAPTPQVIFGQGHRPARPGLTCVSVTKAGRRGRSPPEAETAMPKFQSLAARVARQIQAASGMKYTRALRLFAPVQEELDLAAELRTAGLTGAADNLTRITLTRAESWMWIEAYAEIESEFFDTDLKRVRTMETVCQEAAGEVMRREGFESTGYEPSAEAYHTAFLALSHAGAVPDGQRLASAAIGVFDADPLECSDIIRSSGRRPFTYDSAVQLTGPGTPTAVAARKAARALAAASQVPERGDKEWCAAAGLVVAAVWHGSVAAGFPPLFDRPGFRYFFTSDMESSLPEQAR